LAVAGSDEGCRSDLAPVSADFRSRFDETLSAGSRSSSKHLVLSLKSYASIAEASRQSMSQGGEKAVDKPLFSDS
jgi:hypothetical protein